MFNKIKWRISSLSLLVFIISLFISPAFVSAQEEVPFVSTVNIHDVTYKQVDNTFEMVFSLSNREGVQPDVRYGVLLKQQTPKGDLIIDERAESETLTLGPNEQVVRSVTYLAPKVLEGDYTLYIVAKNNDGAFFALQKVDNIKLSRATEIGVYVDPSTCYLTVSGDEAATKYTTKDAITLNEGEIVTSHCMVENIGSSPLELNPLTATYRRSVFGSEIQTQPVEASTTKLQPKEKVEVSTILPRATDPQSYVVRLGYGFMSNTVMYTYAVKGESGSVRNIKLDKDGYKSGETATILFDWSGPADNLFTARGESDSKLQDPKVFISLNTKTGESCGESILYSLAGSRSHIISMPISGDCPEPDVSIVLSDSVSGALGEYMYALDKTPEAEKKIIDTTDNKFMFYVYLLVAVSVIAIVLLFILSIKKHKDSNTIPPIAPLIFVLMFGSFLMSAPEVKAESIEFGSTRFVTFTATLDKTRYEPNETIRITGLATLDEVADCGDVGLPANCNADKSVSLKIGSQAVLSGTLTAIPLTGSIEVIADGSIGNKTLQFTATNQGQTRNFSIPYEVYSQAASCSGSIPDNARAAESLDNSPLSGGMSWHHVTENSADRCEFICNPNYNWENGSCVANSGSGSGSGSSGVYSVTVVEPQICSPQTEKGTTLTWTVPQGQYALFTSSGYQSVMVQGSGSVSDFPATLTPVTLSMYSCTGNTESTCTSLKDTVVVKGTSEGCGGSSSGVAVQFCTSGDSNCPVISASGEGVTPGTALYPGYSVLFNKTLSLSVSGLSSGAEMCKVFRIHPNGSYVPTPLSHAQQYCTFDSNYSPVTVSGGVARLDIPQVNPDYAVDAVYQVCFKNGGEGNKASCKFITVTPFGTVGDPDLSDGTMHCDSNHYGPDIMVYGLNWYGVHRVDEETTITMNPMQQLGDARAKWTVSAVEYNAQPGDSVSFSRTSGTLDSDTSTTNPNNKFTMTVHGSPRTVGIRISATTNQVTCESTSFSAYRQANFLYANAGNTYQCVGTRPTNSLYAVNGNIAFSPNTPWKHRAVSYVNNLNKCEFMCGSGLKWSNPSSNLWSDGSCVPDDVTPKWHVVSATGGATCDTWQEREISSKNPVEGGACDSEQSNRFHNACNSTNGKRYSCVYPEGAEPAQNTWTVNQGAYIGSMVGAVDECPTSYSPSMSGQSCNQPGRMCYVKNGDSSYGDVYTCGSSVPHIGVGKVLDYETRTPVSGVKVYRSHSGASMVGFDDGLCAVSNSSGSYRAEITNMGTTAEKVEVISGDELTGPPSRQSCYNTDYVYWEGGQIYLDQATLRNGEMIIPIQDVLVRRVTATTQKADLVSADLEIPATAYSGKTFTVRAKSKNDGGGATDVGYQNTFSYRIGQSGNWNTLQTFDSPAIGAGSVNDVADTYTLSIDTKGATQLVYIKHCVNTGLKKAAEISDENNCTERGPVVVTPYTGKVWSKTAIGNTTSLPGLCDLSIEKQPRLGAGCSEEAGYSCLAGDFVYKCVSSN